MPWTDWRACASPPQVESIEHRGGSFADRLWRISLWIAYRLLLAFWLLFRPRTQGVAIAVRHDGRILFVRNSYRRGTGLPAGGVGRGETLRAAAVRELREEVGIHSSPQALRFVADVATSFEYKRDLCSVFELELRERPAIRVDHREVVWAGFLSAQEALARQPTPVTRAYLDRRSALRTSPAVR